MEWPRPACRDGSSMRPRPGPGVARSCPFFARFSGAGRCPERARSFLRTFCPFLHEQRNRQAKGQPGHTLKAA